VFSDEVDPLLEYFTGVVGQCLQLTVTLVLKISVNFRLQDYPFPWKLVIGRQGFLILVEWNFLVVRVYIGFFLIWVRLSSVQQEQSDVVFLIHFRITHLTNCSTIF